MDVAEFDQFAEEYRAIHAGNIALSGETPEYFARYKIDELRRRWTAEGLAEPRAVLDFGTGVGSALPFLARAFPSARLVGLDVSEKSLAVAARRFPGAAKLVRFDGVDPPFEAGSFDLIYSACVFHHVPPAEHPALLRRLRRLVGPKGVMVIFEHNPVNPATRHIVATCPFDANAVLLPANRLKRRQEESGFTGVTISYTAFFPGLLKALRPLERCWPACRSARSTSLSRDTR
jgi:SAM-dependent methyltransferase